MSIFNKILHEATKTADDAVHASQTVLTGNAHHHVGMGHRPERNEQLHDQLRDVANEIRREHANLSKEEIDELVSQTEMAAYGE